jgi:hypothetical protein
MFVRCWLHVRVLVSIHPSAAKAALRWALLQHD